MLGRYVVKRILVAIPVLIVISFSVFMMIQLPPGSYIDTLKEQMRRENRWDPVLIDQLQKDYHINDPAIVQYYYWGRKFIVGDLGRSWGQEAQVWDVLGNYVPITALVSVVTIVFTWSVAIPFGILAAVKRNTIVDYLLTFIGLAAMATPAFVLAIIFQVIMQTYWPAFNPSGLVSPELLDEGVPWYTWTFLSDVAKHLFVPVVIVGVAGTAGMIRIMRANVIDELRKQYVQCARARGVHPALVVLRYPVRVAINPLVSSVGLVLPEVISGGVIVSIVLGLPMLGPITLTSLLDKDTYLATDVVFIECFLAVVGILISDILLSLVDPRIKFEAK